MPAGGEAVLELGAHGGQRAHVEGGAHAQGRLLASQQQVQQRLPLPKGLQRLAQQEGQEGELRAVQVFSSGTRQAALFR